MMGSSEYDTAHINFNQPPDMVISSPLINDTLIVGERMFPTVFTFHLSLSDPDNEPVSVALYLGKSADSMSRVYSGVGNSIEAEFDSPGQFTWHLVAEDLFGNRKEKMGVLTVIKEHTVCFIGHSIVVGLCSDGISGGFRAGVLKGLRDSLNEYEQIRPAGPVITQAMGNSPQDDSCLAVSGSVAREVNMLLDAFPALRADIWVLMIGCNDGFSDGTSTDELKYAILLIDKMHQRDPGSRIYVLNSPPYPDGSRWSYYNNYTLPNYTKKLTDTVSNRSAGGYNIAMVNTFDLLTKDSVFDSSLFCDNVHPNQSGYDLMSDEILKVMYSSVPPVVPFKDPD